MGFLGTELPGKGRYHRWEAADGSWACPVTINEKKCDSDFYQSWAEFVPASSVVHFSFSTLAGAALAQQHHWPVQATASQPHLCLQLCSACPTPGIRSANPLRSAPPVNDPKPEEEVLGRETTKAAALNCIVFEWHYSPWLWMFDWQAAVLAVKCWLVSDSGRPFKYELFQCVTWWRN